MRTIALFVLFTVCAFAHAKDCAFSNPILDSMTKVEVTIESASREMPLLSTAKLADDYRERAAGFQRICKEGIEAEPILFLFPKPFRPAFHMNNVVEPLDIAFVNSLGVIVDIYRMEPYVMGSKTRPLYRPSSVSVVALETRVGYFEEHGIKVGDKLSWQ